MGEATRQLRITDHLLFHAQQTFSEALNLPLRVLNWNALGDLTTLARKAKTPALTAWLRGKSSHEFDVDKNTTLISELCRLHDQDPRAFSKALWLTPASSPHPMFAALESYFPRFAAETTLRLLSHLASMRAGSANRVVRALPGFFYSTCHVREFFLSIPEGVIVAGPVWCYREESPGAPDRNLSVVEFEQTLAETLTRLQEDSDQAPLSLEQRTNLLLLSNSYVTLDQGDVIHKAEVVGAVIDDIARIKLPEGVTLTTFAASEWRRIIHWVLFWNSRRLAPAIREILSPLVPRPWFRRWMLTRFRGGRGSASIAGVASMPITGEWKTTRFEVVTEVEYPTRRSNEPVRRSFAVRHSATTSLRGNLTLTDRKGEQLPEDTEKHLLYVLSRFLDKGRIGRARQDFLLFDRLGFALQQLPLEEIDRREEEIVRYARRLVMADISAFLRFDSLNNVLRHAKSQTTRWIDSVSVDKFDTWLKSVAENPKLRTKSVVYRCLDQEQVICRVESDPDEEPFAKRFVEEPPQIKADRDFWGVDAEDVLVVPVVFHGVALGVLYLASSRPHTFRYSDRSRLLTFVQSFLAELFEAYMVAALRSMNQLVTTAVREGLNERGERELCDGIARNVAQLTAAPAVLMWSVVEAATGSFRVVGSSAPPGSSLLQHGTRLPSLGAVLDDLPSFQGGRATEVVWDEPLYGPILKTARCDHVLFLPLRDMVRESLLGFVSIHHQKGTRLSAALRDELRFLQEDLARHLVVYVEQRERHRQMRMLLGHEIGAALRGMRQSAQRLRKYEHLISEHDAYTFSKGLQDVTRFTDMAQQLLDWTVEKSTSGEFDLHQPNPILAYYHFLAREPIQRTLRLHGVVNSAFHSYAQELTRLGIRFHIDLNRIPDLWVRERAVRHILTNIVDNIAKYGVRHDCRVFDSVEDQFDFLLIVETEGVPLRGEFEKDPDLIFGTGERGAGEAVLDEVDGHGEGLYISRQLAKSWDGSLKVKYQRTKDTAKYRFELAFPRTLADPTDPWTEET